MAPPTSAMRESGIVLNTAVDAAIGGADATPDATTPGARNVSPATTLRHPDAGGGGELLGGNRVEGNFIGTDMNGTTSLGNAIDGVRLENGTAGPQGGVSANTIGGDGSRTRAT